MIFALITLLSGLSLSAIAEYFSIIGLLAIWPASFWPILIMGICVGVSKIVSVTWLKREWKNSPILIRVYLFIAVIVLMIITSVGSYGFLSKAHLQQGASTVDNSAKVERLNQQITREKSTISDDEKLIAQLDTTINSYIGKDRIDKSVAIRRSQSPQRKQLRDDIDASQKKIDEYSDQILVLQSEVRKLELDTGPIRYIAELFYGVDNNADKNIEAAVRIFTLIIVLTLDPLAVILLVAANHTLLRLQNEKNQKIQTEGMARKTNVDSSFRESNHKQESDKKIQNEHIDENFSENNVRKQNILETPEIHIPILQEPIELLNEKKIKKEEDTQDYILRTESVGRMDPDTTTITFETNLQSNLEFFQNQEMEEINEEEKEVIDESKIGDESVAFKNDANEPILYSVETSSISDTPILQSGDTDGVGSPEALAEINEEKNTKEKVDNDVSEMVLDAEFDFDSGATAQSPNAQSVSTEITTTAFEKSSGTVISTKKIQEVILSKDEIKERGPWAQQASTLRELMGHQIHFIPKKVNEEEKSKVSEENYQEKGTSAGATVPPHTHAPAAAAPIQSSKSSATLAHALNLGTDQDWQTTENPKLPKNKQIAIPQALSWLNEFKRI